MKILKYTGWLSFFVWICILLYSCEAGKKMNAAAMQMFQLQGSAQGTTYSIRYIATDSVFTYEKAGELFAELDHSLSIYQPGSLINRFNQSPVGLSIDAHMQIVVKKALEIYKATDGAFDITVYPLVDVWGFANHKQDKLPDSATIRNILSCVGSQYLQLKNNFLGKEKPCVKIDVNGIAQGYSVDHIAAQLYKLGIKNYMVEVGGEIKTRGSNTIDGRDWTIGIEQPGDEGFEPYRALLKVKDAAVTTSGSYRKFYDSDGTRVTHLINPFTGYSIVSDLISITVMAKDAITADGFDNSLMFMGKEKALKYLESHKELEAYLIYKNADGSVGDTATSGFKKFLLPVN